MGNAFEKSTTPQKFGYWSMFRGNAQHNGRCDDKTKPNGGMLMWKYELPTSQFGVAIDSEGNLYFYFSDSSNHPTLLSIDYNGTKRWSITLTNETTDPNSGPVIGINDTIYVATYTIPFPLSNYTCGDYLYAISKEGKILWKFDFKGDGPYSTPVVDSKGVIYINAHTKEGGSLYAIYPNGALKWKRNLGVLPSADPSISPDGDIYVYSYHNKSSLYVIASNGRVKRVYNYNCEAYGAIPVIDEDGTIYIRFGKWMAIDRNGSVKWKLNISDITMPAISRDGAIYITHYNSLMNKVYIYSIEKDSGTTKWKFGIDGESVTYPVIGGSGTIYVCLNATLYAITPNGKVLWQKNMNQAKCGSIIIGKNETIYYLAGNYIYALGGHLNMSHDGEEYGEKISGLWWYFALLGAGGVVIAVAAIYYIKEVRKKDEKKS